MVITKLKVDQNGKLNALLLPLIVTGLLFIGAISFAVWAYGGRQDYKNNVDNKIAVAVTAAQKAEDTKKDAAYFEQAKRPLKTYVGPSAYGSVKVTYPKTWSGYVNENDGSGTVLDAYFMPDVVPAVNDATAYALRVQIVNQSYASVLQSFSGAVTQKQLTVNPYSLPQLKSIVGSRLDGSINFNKTGSMVLLPLRDKTLKIWTEGSIFINDYNTSILPNATFTP